jgi:hypothetical protein
MVGVEEVGLASEKSRLGWLTRLGWLKGLKGFGVLLKVVFLVMLLLMSRILFSAEIDFARKKRSQKENNK